MKRISKRSVLEPALKRFQRLPDLPAGRPLRASPAPRNFLAPSLLFEPVRRLLPNVPLATMPDSPEAGWTIPA